MIDFSKDSVFNLQRIEAEHVNKNVQALFIDGEELIGAYKTVRDQVVFTNLRILTADVEGLTGKRQEIFSLPYAKIQYFGIQTPGFLEVMPDAELALFFANGLKASFEFRGKNDVLAIGRAIAKYSL